MSFKFNIKIIFNNSEEIIPMKRWKSISPDYSNMFLPEDIQGWRRRSMKLKVTHNHTIKSLPSWFVFIMCSTCMCGGQRLTLGVSLLL